MDRVEHYQQIIRQTLMDVVAYIPAQDGIRLETVLDDLEGHYELMQTGWRDKRRVHHSMIHLDIREGKIWVEHDGTNLELVSELLRAGVPKEDIVLAFHPPEFRHLTEFAAG